MDETEIGTLEMLYENNKSSCDYSKSIRSVCLRVYDDDGPQNHHNRQTLHAFSWVCDKIKTRLQQTSVLFLQADLL